MKLDNLVIEELSRMKSLFGYERGKVISEQEIQELGIGASLGAAAAKNASLMKPGESASDYYRNPDGTIKVNDLDPVIVSAKRRPPPIPTELKDINGVKSFQDWLDENKKGWASGYANNVLNKLGKGYGRMGPRTSKAWGLFKDEYLNPQKLVQDITTQEIKQINTGTEPKSDLGTQETPVTNTTTTTSTETISQYPPDEPGQPGEYKDGWYFDEKNQQWYKPQ
jgi:hypothetical protein